MKFNLIHRSLLNQKECTRLPRWKIYPVLAIENFRKRMKNEILFPVFKIEKQTIDFGLFDEWTMIYVSENKIWVSFDKCLREERNEITSNHSLLLGNQLQLIQSMINVNPSTIGTMICYTDVLVKFCVMRYEQLEKVCQEVFGFEEEFKTNINPEPIFEHKAD
jgi:hypothetical protein